MTLIVLKPRLIYLKSHKTAGTSTESALAHVALSLPLEHEAEMKWSRNGFVASRGNGHRRASRGGFVRGVLMSLSHPSLVRSTGQLHHIRNHSTPSQLRVILGDEFWDSATKVVNVRNPFDLVVSDFHWRRYTGQLGNDSFSEFVHSYKRRRVNSELVGLLPGGLEIIRFESLDTDLARLCDTVGIPRVEQLPNFKNQARALTLADYRQFYGREEIQRVEDVFGDWIEAFGYTF